MPKFQLRLLLAVAICLPALAVFPTGEAQPTLLTPANPDTASLAALEQQTFALVNEYRQAHQLPVLVWNGTITQVARAHSRDMATGSVDFGHDGFGDRVRALKTALVGLRGAGENVLMTGNPRDAAHAAVALWLRSPHHLANIRGDYTCSGLGVWLDKNGAIYFTQIFVRTEPPKQPVQDAAAPAPDSPFGLLAAPQTRNAR